MSGFKKLVREFPLHLMLLPGVILLIVFSYIPMAGVIIAFQKFIPAKGMFGDQEFIGLENFKYVFNLPNFGGVIYNTVIIAIFKILLGLIVPLIVTILINELKNVLVKKGIQTAIYLPHFLSWVVLGGIFIDILSPSDGIVNKLIEAFGGESVFFLGSNETFRGTMVVTETWKEFGYGTIVYLAAVTGIDPGLYEAAKIDGANRWQQIWHVTLPGIRIVIVLMTVLSLGNVLNAGFDQIFNLYSPPVYASGDILDTFVYRIGLLDAQFGVATAVGLFKSIISFLFVSISYLAAYKFADYELF
ncbi:ABC transporter permease [Enterococcus aquimarinus]|uniref:Binding-protein-dependent transport systems inner membrane component n=1 Tax=Enterococcus aquimarinus TaxID=328396 RepID=A0A1L8QMT8_9ENTE|nr:ABC transporter permease subunit [Enterococcus aquimarinus]OJG08831.1 binding-protein-dependent transport systems inner membrane component [Enterococcus aquimarinus]